MKTIFLPILGSAATIGLLIGGLSLMPSGRTERGSGRDEFKQFLAEITEIREMLSEQQDEQEEKPERKRRTKTEIAQEQTSDAGPPPPPEGEGLRD